MWISGDNGQTWHVVCKAAPWAARNDDTGGITENGVLVVTAGRPAYNNGGWAADFNDVWASLDGGHTWGQCSAAAEFPDPRYIPSAFDAQGQYYIAGGLNDTDGLYTDVRVLHFLS